jgi:Flp pilus assembly protein TadG
MNKVTHQKRWWQRVLSLCRGSEGAQILELAITLPLVTAMFIATYDFGQAFNVKQKLVSATREGARLGANQSTSDLTSATSGSCPASVCAIRDVVDEYLIHSNIGDCGLPSATVAQQSPPAWVWTFTASGCPGGNLVLTVNRGQTYNVTVPSSSGNVTVVVESTQVSLSYPYQWHVNRIMHVLAPGSSYAAVTQISTNSVVQNLD